MTKVLPIHSLACALSWGLGVMVSGATYSWYYSREGGEEAPSLGSRYPTPFFGSLSLNRCQSTWRRCRDCSTEESRPPEAHPKKPHGPSRSRGQVLEPARNHCPKR